MPAEFDELLRGLQDVTGAIDPDTASDLITEMATLLDGQGEEISSLLEEGAGTVEIVADKATEIGDIVESIAGLSAALRDRTGSVEELLRNYNLLAEVLVANRNDLDATITQLDRAVVALTGLLERHGQDLPADVEVLTQAGSTLEINIDRLHATLSDTVRLFETAQRAYDPERRMLRVNNQINQSLTQRAHRRPPAGPAGRHLPPARRCRCAATRPRSSSTAWSTCCRACSTPGPPTRGTSRPPRPRPRRSPRRPSTRPPRPSRR